MVPQWMAFPPTAYTSRGGVGSVKAAARVAFDLSAPAYLDPDQQDRVSGAEDTPLAA
jgi:ParB family chromosome partitioning protein